MTEEEFAAELRDLCVDTAPSRFALCAVCGEHDDGIVVGWGLALPGRAVVCNALGGGLGHFRSAETAHRLFSRRGTVRLIWIDPAPAPAAPDETDEPDEPDDD
ncbi:MAG TPA: hypothetical protein VFX16_24740 [Pseudonocardiaceae bacterium]|nr:hypothetical protein [Pseudonocardiaceae bacterium]